MIYIMNLRNGSRKIIEYLHLCQKMKNKLEENQIKKLEEINEWYWVKDIFNKTYNEVNEWVEINNRIPLEKSKDEIENRLGKWCSRQRYNKRKNKLEEYKREKLEK